MTEKDQIKLIEDAHGERIWQPVVRVSTRKGPETVAFNRLDSYSAAYMFAEKEAAKFAAKEEVKPIAERREVVGFGVRNIDAPPASQQALRPVDSRLVNIDRLAQEIARAMGLAKVNFTIKAMTIANAVFAKASRGEIQLYCEVDPYPFNKDENETMHGGLRLTIADADALKAFYLAAPSDTLELSIDTPRPMQRQAERWKACVDAGLPMPSDTYGQYPRGIAKVAKAFGIKRQSTKEDLDKNRERAVGN